MVEVWKEMLSCAHTPRRKIDALRQAKMYRQMEEEAYEHFTAAGDVWPAERVTLSEHVRGVCYPVIVDWGVGETEATESTYRLSRQWCIIYYRQSVRTIDEREALCEHFHPSHTQVNTPTRTMPEQGMNSSEWFWTPFKRSLHCWCYCLNLNTFVPDLRAQVQTRTTTSKILNTL